MRPGNCDPPFWARPRCTILRRRQDASLQIFIWRGILFVLFLTGTLWIPSWLAAHWLIVSVPLDRADAIVVLSGSSTIIERAQHAAKLYSEKRAPKIILTNDDRKGGWVSAEQRNPFFYEIALNELRQSGVPQQNIEILEPAVHSTWDEAILVRQYSKTHNLRSILIVTSSYHSRRALWTFRTLIGKGTQVGLDPVPTGIQTPPPATWWLHARGWQLVFIEYLKLVNYRFRGVGES